MFGPLGASGDAGGLPRPAGIVCTSSVRLSGIHCTGSPCAALMATPAILRALAVAVSADPQFHAVVAVELVKAKCRPSGLQRGVERRAPAGSATGVCPPPSIFISAIPTKLRGGRCCPLLAGLMRWPASRSMGCARSAMGG